MQMPGWSVSVVFFGGAAAGRLIVDHRPDAINLVDIAVLPQFRRSGIATTLIRQLQAEERRPIELRVDKGNQNAIRLYETLGFSVAADAGFDLSMRWERE